MDNHFIDLNIWNFGDLASISSEKKSALGTADIWILMAKRLFRAEGKYVTGHEFRRRDEDRVGDPRRFHRVLEALGEGVMSYAVVLQYVLLDPGLVLPIHACHSRLVRLAAVLAAGACGGGVVLDPATFKVSVVVVVRDVGEVINRLQWLSPEKELHLAEPLNPFETA